MNWDFLIEALEKMGTNIISSALILIIGMIAIKLALKFVDGIFSKSRMDPIIIGYVRTCVKVALYILLATIVLSNMGVSIVSMIAVMSAACAAIALALQDSLSNLAAGILIIINKPFDRGDYVETASVNGVVDEIHLFNCRLHTLDNKFVVVPNNTLVGGVITNYSYAENRRVDSVVSVGYDDDLDKVKATLRDIADRNPLILKDPAMLIGVTGHGESSVDIDFRVWCKNENYWAVYYYIKEEILRAFQREQISIPYPQLDVHIKKED